MAERKTTYKDSISKKQVREFLFSFFIDRQLDKIIGLGGPDITDYIKFCESKGYADFEIFENHADTMIRQLKQVKHIRTLGKISLKYGDILDADANRHNVLYDLDYCCTVRYMRDHIAKFKDNFIMTFARRIPDKETVKTFFTSRSEKIISRYERLKPFQHTIFKTEAGNKYVYVKYRDTSNMCCFAKL